QVAGYSPLESGLALLPESLIMFALSGRFGALADRIGPRLFMGGGPLIAGAGMLMLLGVGVRVDYLTQVLPGILVFSLGLAITVASGQSSLQAFRVGIGVAGALVIIGGLIGAAGIRNPKRIVRARQCSGGQLAGAPLDAAGLHASQAA